MSRSYNPSLFFKIFLIMVGVLALVSPTAAQSGLRFVIEDINAKAFPQMEVYLSVSDSQGLPISGLAPEAFSLFEDGKVVPSFEVTPIRNMQQELSFVLAIDTSGSMNQDGPPTRIVNAKAAAQEFVQSLSAQDQVGLVTFGEQVTVVEPVTNERSPMITSLENLKPGGDTYLYDGLIKSIELLENVKTRRIIILIADGQDSSMGQYTYDDVIDKAVKAQVPIYTLSFGSADTQELGSIATLTGGVPQFDPSSAKLKEAFSRILQILREQYLLRYESNIPANGNQYDLSVSLDYTGENYSATRTFVAQPTTLQISLPDYSAGQTIAGKVTFAPEIDGPTDIEKMEIYLDGALLDTVVSAPFVYNWDGADTPEGMHTFGFVVQDKAGNTGKFEVDLNVVRAITVEFLNPHDGDALSIPTTVQVQVDSSHKVNSVEFFVEDKPIGKVTQLPYEAVWPVDQYEPGEYRLRVVVTDSAGNVVQSGIRVDVRLPIEFISPQENAVLNGEPEIALDVDPTFDLEQLVVSANGEEIATFSAPPYTTKWVLTSVLDGEYVLRAEGTDRSGNIAVVEINVSVDQGRKEIGGGGGNGGVGLVIAVVVILALIVLSFWLRRQRSSVQGGTPELSVSGKFILVEVQGKNPKKIWPLDAQEIRLGRKSTENDIPLMGTSASRHMAVIQSHDNQKVLYSLNPDNPAVVNSVPVDRERVLQPGDVLMLGESVFRVEVR